MSGRASGRVVVVGAGAVGLGVLAEQWSNAGFEVEVVARTAAAAAGLRSAGATLHYTSGTRAGRALRIARALPISDRRGVVAAVREADVVALAVSSGSARLAPVLAEALVGRRLPVDVLVCDNRPHATESLRAALAEHLDRHELDRHGLVPVLVDRMANRLSPATATAGADVAVEPGGQLYVDGRALRRTVPGLEQAVLVDDHDRHVAEKLWVFSAGHAAVAYLGWVRGWSAMAGAAADPEIRAVALAAMREGQEALRERYGTGAAHGEEEVDGFLQRFGAPLLHDTVDRVARDPVRKLRPDDRLLGPARAAARAGAHSGALVTVAAAAWLCAVAQGSAGPGTRSLAGVCREPAGRRTLRALSAATERIAQGMDLREVMARARAETAPHLVDGAGPW